MRYDKEVRSSSKKWKIQEGKEVKQKVINETKEEIDVQTRSRHSKKKKILRNPYFPFCH